MKKYLLLIGVIISIVIQASAAKEDIYMTIYRKGNESEERHNILSLSSSNEKSVIELHPKS